MLERYQLRGQKDTRSGFGDGMLELGTTHPEVVALCADLTGSLKLDAFKEKFPDRFIQCGISEANMMGVAAGLTIGGKIPFATTFANFATGRVYDQIRQSIAYSGKPVKIGASHAGLTLGEDGATHQILEDIGLMQMLPGMVVINPCDYTQTKAATKAAADWNGPVYLRFGRPVWPVFMPENEKFEIGKGILMQEGSDVSIFCTGHMVWKSVEACKILWEKGIRAELINIHTIKPLDVALVEQSVRKTRCAVVTEEHNRIGGLGSTIALSMAGVFPVPMEFVAVADSFGESGKPEELLEKYGLTVQNIVLSAERAVQRKS
jgi:transketolase